MRYIAFLRAINVGGHTVKMDRLRALFEELGCGGVATYIASGNVIFEAEGQPAELERAIAAHLERALGYAVATFLRTPAELAAALAYPAFSAPPAEGAANTISFLHAPPGAEAAARLLALRSDADDLRLHGRELYWRSAGKISESRLSGAHMERALRMPATMRNISMLAKLAAAYPAAG